MWRQKYLRIYLRSCKGASTTNRFSVLDSEEIHDDKDSIVMSTSSDEDCSVYESKRTGGKKSKTARQSAQASSQNQRKQHSNEKNTQTESGPSSQSHKSRNKRNIEICGDPMTKHLQAYRIGRSTNERVSSKSFSGATCKDMKHYIVPTLEKKPDELILHIGTNDLKDTAPKEVVRDIMALKDFIVKKSPQIKVTISELTLRTDDKKINDKVTNFNELLKKACINSKLTVIEHTDIDDQCVNQSGVHLNKKGTSQFALSIIKHLRAHDDF